MFRTDFKVSLTHLRRHWAPVLVLLLLIGAGWWWQGRQRDLDTIAAKRLERKGGELILKLGERVRAYEQVLWGAAGLFAASDDVTREAWHAYIDRLSLRERYPGILAIGYAERVPPGRLEGFERAQRAQGFSDFGVWPDGARREHASIIYVEPFAGLNLRAVGYDMFAEPVRQEAMERARDSGRAAISGPVTLLQDDRSTPAPGLLRYAPVYRRGAPISTPEERREALQGWVYIAHLAGAMMFSLLGPDMEGVDVGVFDRASDGARQQLFNLDGIRPSDRASGARTLRTSALLTVGGRRWEIECEGSNSALSASAPGAQPLTAWLPAAVSVLLFGLVLANSRMRVRAEGLARSMTTELKASQDNSPVGVFVVTADGRRISYANGKACEIAAIAPERTAGFRWADRLHPADREHAFSMWKDAFRRRVSFQHEHRLLHPDGRSVWVRVQASPIVGDEHLRGYAGTIEDITDRKEAELALAANRNFLDAMINALPQPVFVKDAAHRWVLINDAFAALYGRPRQQLVGRTDHDFMDSASADTRWDEDDEALRESSPLVLETPVVTADGEVRWFLKSKRSIRLADGSAYVVGMSTDITRRKEIEEALRAEAALQQARSDQPLVVSDAEADPLMSRLAAIIGPKRSRALLSATVHYGEEEVGLLWVGCDLPRQWTRVEIDAVQEVAEALGVALRSAGVEANRREAERGLRDSQERLQLALWASNVGLWSWDVVNDRATFTPEWKRHLGYEPEEMPDDLHFWVSLVHPDEQKLVLQDLGALLEMPTPSYERQFRLRHRDGSYRWVLARAGVEVDADGKLLRLTGAHVDITAQKQAELAAERNRRFLQAMIDALPEGVFVKDEQGRWLLVNEATCRELGVRREDLINKLPHEALPAAFAADVAEQDRLTFDAGHPMTFEQAPRVVDGREVWLRKTASVVRLEDGTRYLVGANADITTLKQAAREVERSRSFLDSVMEAIPHSIYVKDRNHRWIMVNSGFARLFGVSREQMLHGTDTDYLPASEAALAYRHDDAAFAAAGPITSEEQASLPSGRVSWFIKTKVAVGLSDGSRYLVCVALDVTERHEAAQALERSRQFLESLINALPQPIFVKDEQHRLIHINDAFCRLRGRSRDELIGADDRGFLDPATAQARFSEDKEVLAADKPLVTEYLEVLPDGRQAWMVKTKTPVRLPDGSRAIAGLLADITESKLASLEAEKARRFLEALINAVPNPIFVKDVAHRWVLVNDAFCRYMGRTREELIERSDADLLAPEHARVMFEEDDETIGSGVPMLAEQFMRPPGGRHFWGLKSKCAIRLPDGSVYTVSVVTDISERKHAEQGLLESQERLRLLNAIANRMTQGGSPEEIVRVAVDGLSGMFPGLRWTYSTVGQGGKARAIYSVSTCSLADSTGVEYELAPDDPAIAASGTARVVRIDDFTPASAEAALQLPEVRALLAVQLKHDGNIVGLLAATGAQPREWSEREMQVATEVSEYLAVSWRNGRIEQRRRDAEEALRASEARLAAVIESAIDAIIIFDEAGTVREANPAAVRIFGYSQAELVGRNVNMLMTAPIHQAQDGQLNRYAESGAAHIAGLRRELTGRRNDGSTVVVDAAMSEVRIGSQHLSIGLLRDISARKAAEEALRASEARFRMLTEMSSDWYWEQDEQLRFVLVSAGATREGGFDMQHLLGRERWETVRAPADDPDWTCHKALLEQRLPFADLVLHATNAAGAQRVLSISGEPVFDSAGGFHGYRGVTQDITERVRAEEELRRHRDNLQQLVEERTRELVLAKDAAEAIIQGKGRGVIWVRRVCWWSTTRRSTVRSSPNTWTVPTTI